MSDAPERVETHPTSFESGRAKVVAAANAFDKGGRTPLSPVIFAGLVRIAEAVVLSMSGILIVVIYPGLEEGDASQYYFSILFVSTIAAVAFHKLGFYTTAALRGPMRYGLRIGLAWASLFPSLFVVAFLLKVEHHVSRVWLVSWLLLSPAVIFTMRWQIANWIRRSSHKNLFERRTVIVGGGPAGAELLTRLEKYENSDLNIYGVFDDRADERSPDSVAGYPKLGTVDDLIEFARTVPIDLVIFTLPITAEERLQDMLRKLWVLPVDIRLAAHSNKLRLHKRSYSYISDLPVLDVFDKPIADWDIVVKVIFDRIVGAFALIMLSPVILLAAIAIKLDSRGPVFFRQKRHGFNNELIEVYKLRSLYQDQEDAAGSKPVTRNDLRVTRVGRFIRRTSIDELPQLFNVVFKGDLSLVGPRPHAVHGRAANQEYIKVVDGYFARHRVRPGITGWAQVNGWRGEIDTAEKLQRRMEYDLYYIENWSIFFDLYILAATPFALLNAENAF